MGELIVIHNDLDIIYERINSAMKMLEECDLEDPWLCQVHLKLAEALAHYEYYQGS